MRGLKALVTGGCRMDNGAGSYRRFLEGDDDSLSDLVREYRDGLMLFINTYVGNIAVAEDLTEDTFVKLVIKKPKFHGESSFKSWLYAIGRNAAIDYKRRAAREALVPFDVGERPDADDFVEKLENEYLREDRKIALHRAMRGLKEEYRRILWLVYFEELRYRDAAKVMGKTRRSVESLAYQARRALKDALEKEGMDDEKL